MTEPGSGDRLSFTIVAAVAFHALLIFGFKFGIGESDSVAPTLNITLATHKSAQAPEKADFLAQNNQQASGSEDEVKELTTNEFSPITDVVINEITPDPMLKAELQQSAQAAVITSENDFARPSSVIDLTTLDEKDNEEEVGEEEIAIERNEKFSSLQAKLDKLRQDMAREPRVTRHTSVSAKASEEAEYYNRWSDKIIRVGNKNFPEEALKNNIFGSLRLSVRIRANGTISEVELLKSSGHKILDDAAIRIVRLSSPFDAFPPEIRSKTDIFEIIRTWEFEITGLSTH